MIAEPFALVLALANALGVSHINELPACWEHQVDEQWWIAVNGHPFAQKATPPDAPAPLDVPPFHCVVTYNGWPAGLFDPRGGIIAAGDGANEFAFSEALRRVIRDHLPPDVCMLCGCTEHEACEGGCTWVELNVCSSCVAGREEVRHG